MSIILAFDTSTETCLVSLLVNDETINLAHLAAREHAQRILPMVDQVLAEAGIGLSDCDAVAFGRGPGSFTGLRIAAGIAQGLAFGQDLSVIPVSSLQALAYSAYGALIETGVPVADLPSCLSLIDARMDEVYCAEYRANDWGGIVIPEALSAESVVKPEGLEVSGAGKYLVSGDGLRYQDRFAESVRMQLQTTEAIGVPSSQAIAELALPIWQEGGGLMAELAAPVYVRDTVAWKKLPGRE
jgi:tRNA threonylcarbamoyladenosine biosynthesis protein TsaB